MFFRRRFVGFNANEWGKTHRYYDAKAHTNTNAHHKSNREHIFIIHFKYIAIECHRMRQHQIVFVEAKIIANGKHRIAWCLQVQLTFDVWHFRTRSAHIHTKQDKGQASILFFPASKRTLVFFQKTIIFFLFYWKISVTSSKLNIQTKWLALNRWLLRRNNRQRNKLTEKRYVQWCILFIWCCVCVCN